MLAATIALYRGDRAGAADQLRACLQQDPRHELGLKVLARLRALEGAGSP